MAEATTSNGIRTNVEGIELEAVAPLITDPPLTSLVTLSKTSVNRVDDRCVSV